jgi:hypothetical protein
MIKEARHYLKNGLSVIVTDNSKRSLFQWKKYQSEIITDDDLQQQMAHPKAEGIAIVCGAVSGGLEVIDVDLKNDITGELWDKLTAQIQEAGLWNDLKIAKTKSGGYHIFYRCEIVEGNQKLAMRKATADELVSNPQLKQVVVIETRGEAGYVIASPTKGYEWVRGTLAVLTVDQREMLLEVCRSFNEVFDEPITSTYKTDTKEFGVSPFDDYNSRGNVIGLLISHGWMVVRESADKVVFKRPGTTDSKSSGDYNKKLGWFSVFTTNSCFLPNKAYKPYAVYAMLECGGDFKEAARKLSAEGYGEKRQSFGAKLEREVFKRKQDGMSRDELVTYVVQSHQKNIKEAQDIVETLDRQWGDRICTFWDIDEKSRAISINRNKMMRFLRDTGGFFIYFYDKTSTLFKLVRLQDGFIEESSTQQVKEFLKSYINGLPDSFDGGVTPDDLLEVLLKGSGTYFQDSFFEFFDAIDPDFLRSEKDKQYFPFKNGVVVISRDDVKLKTYGDLKRVVWKNRVVPFDVTIDQDFDISLCEYANFIDKICGDDDERKKYCWSIIGYLLHTYKDAAKPYAIILAEETDNDKDGGGTGKGIFVKAISQLLRTVKLDGKNFKIDKSFALQRVTLDTQLISIEDCDKGIDFEKFNSQITEGSTIEKKNKDELFIDYKDSPKFIFSTNYMINLKGNHGKRRGRVFEFTPFFNPANTPLDYFGHLMFDEWDNDEWNRFYNFLFFCCSIYMINGIKQPPHTDRLKRKQIKVNYGDEFLEYFTDMMSNGHINWHQFGTEYSAFLNQNDFEKKDYSNKRFKKAMQDSCDVYGYKYESRRNTQNGNHVEFRILSN